MTDLAQYAGRRGNRPKVSQERLTKFIGYVRAGLTLGAAARGVGIGDQTRMDWMRRGRLELIRIQDAGNDPLESIDPTAGTWPTTTTWSQIPPGFDPYEWPYVVFAVAVEKALAEFEAQQLAVIQRAANGSSTQPSSWQASAWLLERRFPELYGRAEARLRHQVDVQVQTGPASQADPLSVEDLEAQLLGLTEADRERGA